VPNWSACLATALVNREELRKQKWLIKSLELQLRAAKSLAHPQLNFVSTYQMNGFGDNLFGPNGPRDIAADQLQSAYRTLAQGNQTAWTLGLQFAVPLGMRNALTQVRNTELRLAKARAALAAQELEISHELAAAFQAIDYWHQHAQTAHSRLAAAHDQYEAVEADYQAQRQPLEVLLRAQARRAAAEAGFHRGVVEYNKALLQLQYRQGTLLASNNIRLGEAAWTPEAYKDALRRAKARSFELEAPSFDPVRQLPASLVRSAPGYNRVARFAGAPADMSSMSALKSAKPTGAALHQAAAEPTAGTIELYSQDRSAVEDEVSHEIADHADDHVRLPASETDDSLNGDLDEPVSLEDSVGAQE
jgi:hypothetical protein